MSRTLTLTNTLANLDGTPKAGAAVQVYLQTPGGVPVVNLEGRVFFNGQTLGGESTTTDATGLWSAVVIYPGDLRDAATNAAATCQLVVNEAGTITVSPLGVAYAASITVSSWYPSASTSGTLRMLLGANTVANVAEQGVRLGFDITANAIAPNSQVLIAGQEAEYTTDDAGNIAINQVPTSLLNPANTTYILSFPNGDVWYYAVPTLPTGSQGAYAGGTTYTANAGTKASPADVVSEAGVYYQYINVTPAAGHDPATSPTYWQVWPGEPIDWHLTQVSIAGAVAIDATGIAHDTNVSALIDDPVQAPATLDDDLHNLAARTGRAIRTVTASTTILATDDYLLLDATSGNITLTLIAASARVRPYSLIRKDGTAHTVSIVRAGSDTINGATSLALNTQYLWAVLKPDTALAWYAQTGTGGASLTDATISAIGGVLLDQAPAAGHPIALTQTTKGQPFGTPWLDSAGLLPSAYLPTPPGGAAESGRWARSGSNPILAASQAWEGNVLEEPTVLYESGVFRLWYGSGLAHAGMGYATSTDGVSFTKSGSNPVLGFGTGGVTEWAHPSVLKVNGTYYSYAGLSNNAPGNFGVATSPDGTTWTYRQVALTLPGTGGLVVPGNSYVWCEGPGRWFMLFDSSQASLVGWNISLASSTDGLTFALVQAGPLSGLPIVIGGDNGGMWMPYPAQKTDGLYELWYHAATGAPTGLPNSIYRATSTDLLTWTSTGLVMATLGGGFDQAADPSVLEVNGTCYLYFEDYNNGTGHSSLSLATFTGTLHQIANGGASTSGGSVTTVSISVPARQSASVANPTTTPAITIADNTQSQNTVFAGPTSGVPAQPTFRALGPIDLPIAGTAQRGAAKADGTTILAAADGTFSATASGSTLASLGDAGISTPANGDLLQYHTSDSKWHNIDPTAPGAGGIGWAPLTDASGNLIVDASGSCVMVPFAV